MTMKTETEIRAKAEEAQKRYDQTDDDWQAEKEYMDAVLGVLDWILGEGDDPFADHDPLE